MYVTERMLAGNLLSSLTQAESNMATLERNLASGQSIHMPSDAPSGTQTLLSLTHQVHVLAAYQQNIQDGNGWLSATGTGLKQLQDIAQAAHTLAVAQATGSVNATDRSAAATQAQTLLNESLQAANARYQGIYLFAGTSNVKPFSLSGGVVSYAGNGAPITRQVGSNASVPVTVTGADLAGTGIFSALSSLQSDLSSNNTTALSTDGANLQTAIDQLTGLSATAGARSQSLKDFASAASAQTTSLQKLQTQVDGVDPTQAITQYMQDRATFQQALAIGAQILTPNLVSHLFP